MLPWTLLDHAPLPGSADEIKLYKRGTEYSIRVANYELMNSRVHGSEEALAELAWEKIAGRPRPRILIGGLGLGYTLAAVLRLLGPKGEAVVAELVPAVIAWNRGPLGPLAGNPLRDSRVKIREADVADVIREEPGGFDAILLDVDTAPRALTAESNGRLYTAEGIRTTHAALRPNGVLGIWSGGADPAFLKRLERARFRVSEVRARARTEHGGARYLIWLAQRGK
jgi:spermidine synthase